MTQSRTAIPGSASRPASTWPPDSISLRACTRSRGRPTVSAATSAPPVSQQAAQAWPGGIAAPEHPLSAAVPARVLHHPAELLRPEVRNGVVVRAPAQDVRGRRRGPVQRDVPVLEAQPLLIPLRPERGAVSDRVHARGSGTQPGVGSDAVVKGDGRARQPGHRRAHPDGRQHHIRGQPVAAGQGNAAWLNGVDALPEPQVHARLAVPGHRGQPDLRADRGGKRRGRGLQHRDRAPPARCRGGHLGTDPARPDDREPGSGPE